MPTLPGWQGLVQACFKPEVLLVSPGQPLQNPKSTQGPLSILCAQKIQSFHIHVQVKVSDQKTKVLDCILDSLEEIRVKIGRVTA